jgi:hypothetical protein
MFGSSKPPYKETHGIRIVWSGGPMRFKEILEITNPDISEPNFASSTKRVEATIEDFKLIAICDDS